MSSWQLGPQGDAFDEMFEGMGASCTLDPPHGAQDDTRMANPSKTVTGTSERADRSNSDSNDYCLHPDTLLPLLLSVPYDSRSSQRQVSVVHGWSVGYVLADGGVIRKVVPETPADCAQLIHQSADGVWQGKSCVGDKVYAPASRLYLRSLLDCKRLTRSQWHADCQRGGARGRGPRQEGLCAPPP
jgi:hypothetical protein